MSRVICSTNVSLDGFIEGPNSDLSWASIDEELHAFVNTQCRAAGGFLCGRLTYELMMAFWPTADEDPTNPPVIVEFARIWKSIPKFVFSRSQRSVAPGDRLVTENLVDEVLKLKAQSSQDLMLGGADLAATFMRHGLIDEYQIYTHPVILGSGTPLFKPMDDRTKLQLIETRTFRSGVVLLHYKTEGK